jgi:hypothetical protein
MSKAKLLEKIRKDDRYFFSLLAVFILGLLLLFYKDLDLWIQQVFVPSFTIYIIGSALIAQIQMMLGNRKKLRCENKKIDFTGLETWQFSMIITSHIFWLLLFIWHLYKSQTYL